MKGGDLINTILPSNNCGDFMILEYENSRRVKVRFLKTGYECVSSLRNLKLGQVKDRMLPSVFGVGFLGDAPTKIDSLILREYSIWVQMLRRCYSLVDRSKYPSYENCSVSDYFLNYSNFSSWCNKQIGFGNQGWHLDKDLLVKGNKVYSEETCIFLPQELNSLVIRNNSCRGKYPIGVSFNKDSSKFMSQLSMSFETKYIGYYNTPEEAFYAYKEAKEAFIKEQAKKWKDKIDPRACEALMNYEVDIND